MVSSETERLIFDLEGLQFMDSSGIAMFVSVARKVREVELRNPPAIVRRLFELTGLANTFRVTPLKRRLLKLGHQRSAGVRTWFHGQKSTMLYGVRHLHPRSAAPMS